jgi:hypothetical protein
MDQSFFESFKLQRYFNLNYLFFFYKTLFLLSKKIFLLVLSFTQYFYKFNYKSQVRYDFFYQKLFFLYYQYLNLNILKINLFQK